MNRLIMKGSVGVLVSGLWNPDITSSSNEPPDTLIEKKSAPIMLSFRSETGAKDVVCGDSTPMWLGSGFS